MHTTAFTVTTFVVGTMEQVWDKWTNPQHITHWNFASDDWCCPRASNDLVVGGKFNTRMESKDGSMGFDFEGVYTAVEPYKQINYVLADERTISVQFEEVAGGIQVTEIVDPETENPVEMQQAGWQSILNNFKRHAERE
ncbi:MAG: SRPBCC domain-containing protein [Moraxellaceae bacterium]